jgi:hypothetical protein
MKWLVYSGPHQEVEVPHDEVAGGVVFAVRGKAVEVSDDVAASLLEQGEDQVAEGDDRAAQHDRTWRTATTKEVAAAQKAADPADASVSAASEETPKEGEK